jgi:hypothetical protein
MLMLRLLSRPPGWSLNAAGHSSSNGGILSTPIAEERILAILPYCDSLCRTDATSHEPFAKHVLRVSGGTPIDPKIRWTALEMLVIARGGGDNPAVEK